MSIVLVEWRFDGKERYQICDSIDSLICCISVLHSLGNRVQDTMVYTPELIAHLVSLGMAGHA